MKSKLTRNNLDASPHGVAVSDELVKGVSRNVSEMTVWERAGNVREYLEYDYRMNSIKCLTREVTIQSSQWLAGQPA